jgi:hypothetical protein
MIARLVAVLGVVLLIAGCVGRDTDNRSVVLITVGGGGHQWPTFATEKLWQFFAAHPAEHYMSCAVVEKM